MCVFLKINILKHVATAVSWASWIELDLTLLNFPQMFESFHHHLSNDHLMFLVLWGKNNFCNIALNKTDTKNIVQ